MTTHMLRNGLAASLASYALATIALPVAAETDPTSVPVVVPAESTGALAPAAMVAADGVDRASGRRVYRRGLSPWWGSAVAFADSALDVAASAREVAGTAMGDAATEARGRDAGRELVGPRLRSRILGWFEQPPAAASRSSLERLGHKGCDALCTVLTYGVGGDGREDSARVRTLMVRLVAGYELPHARRISLRPRVQRVRGHPRTGLSVRISGI